MVLVIVVLACSVGIVSIVYVLAVSWISLFFLSLFFFLTLG